MNFITHNDHSINYNALRLVKGIYIPITVYRQRNIVSCFGEGLIHAWVLRKRWEIKFDNGDIVIIVAGSTFIEISNSFDNESLSTYNYVVSAIENGNIPNIEGCMKSLKELKELIIHEEKKI